MKISKFRDITLIDLNENQMLAVACDSSGGIGEKSEDIIKVSPDIVGYFTACVALSEIIAIGANPITIINTLSVEMNNTGKQIIKGIKKAVEALKLTEDNIVTGSTEENFPVIQTGMGITVLGIIDKSKYKKPKTKEGSIAVAVGIPKVGNDVILDKGKEIMTIETLLKLIDEDYIQEILPVGSKGILFEANEMAITNNLEFKKSENVNIDLHKSAGPATTVIVSINEKDLKKLTESTKIPVNVIGNFI